MNWSLGCHMRADAVGALLKEVEDSCKGRADFTPGLEREKVAGAIHALLWAYGSRASDTAFGYAMLNLYQCLGIDWANSQIAWLPASGTEARQRQDPQGLAPKGDGPTREAGDAQT